MDKKPIKKTNKKTVVTKKTDRKKLNTGKLQKTINIASLLIFILSALYYLPIYNKNVLYKIQELSIFVPTDYFFTTHLKIPGGLLSWLGTFFTQFFYYPWLGSSIFILLILLVQFLCIKAFKIATKHYPLTFIISFALLLSVSQLGYLIFSIKAEGYIYSNLLGLISTLTALWLYKKITSMPIRAIAAGLFIFTAYPLFGFYALLAGILFCIYEGIKPNKNLLSFIPIAVTLFTAILIPYILYLCVYSQIDFAQIYTAGLPEIPFLKIAIIAFWSPYFAILISVLFFSVFSARTFNKESTLATEICVVAIYLLAFYAFYQKTYKDDNFQTEIAMDIAIFDNKWEEVLKLAAKQKDEPTRLMVMKTNLALQKLNRGGDEIFSYKNGGKAMKTPVPYRLIVIAGKQLYYQYGQTNFCYHWCMEDMVERGMKVEYLKYMVKCALIKNELPLAQKYNNILKQTLFHKSWASKYQKYIDRPQSMLEDTEFKAIQPLTAYKDTLDDNSGVLELTLLNDFAYLESGTPLMFEISLQNSLILRNSELFWPRFFIYVRSGARIPKHYQEAALLFSFYEKKVDVSAIKFDPKITTDFKQFIELTKQNSGSSNEMNKQVFASFSNSYWYYYFFMKDIKIS